MPVSADTPDVIVGVVAIEASSDVTVVGVKDPGPVNNPGVHLLLTSWYKGSGSIGFK